MRWPKWTLGRDLFNRPMLSRDGEPYCLVPIPQPHGSLEKAIADVAAFHKATDMPILDKPQFPPPVRSDLRLRLIDEETDELVDAYYAHDLVAVADALADLIYVAIGMALEFGIPLDRVWDEVQRTNMAKVNPTTGKVKRRDDGKILKPEGWMPPNIEKALGL